MIVVHHLNNSRSQRVLWLLEELGEPFEIKRYERDKFIPERLTSARWSVVVYVTWLADHSASTTSPDSASCGSTAGER